MTAHQRRQHGESGARRTARAAADDDNPAITKHDDTLLEHGLSDHRHKGVEKR